MSEQQLIRRDELAWNPLEDRGPPPEYVPPWWTSEHAQKRLVEALRTLRNMPMTGNGQQSTNCWPPYLHEWSDRVHYADDPVWKAERAAEANFVRLRPSSIEIMRMETAIWWPGQYLMVDHPHLLRVVVEIAHGKSMHRDIAHIAKTRLKLPSWTARRWNEIGLKLIAKGLRLDRVEVF